MSHPRKFQRFGRPAAPAMVATACLLLGACAPAQPHSRIAALVPQAPPPALTPVSTAPPLSLPRSTPAGGLDQSCAELQSWASTKADTVSTLLSSATTTDQVPDPKTEEGKANDGKREERGEGVVDASMQSGSSTPVNLAERIRARSAEISAAAAAMTEAEKAASSGRTARAAELYAANWRASPDDWRSAFRAVELWSRIGDYMRAEILLKEIETSAASTHDEAAVKRAHELDDTLGVLGSAANEATRFWRRTFALEVEGRYAEGVATLHRLQRFDSGAPGYYVREASLFARCGDALRAGDAVARGSAAGVVYAGRWSPARDPAIVKLWRDPVFASAIRETLGDAGVEEFEEAARPSAGNAQPAR